MFSRRLALNRRLPYSRVAQNEAGRAWRRQLVSAKKEKGQLRGRNTAVYCGVPMIRGQQKIQQSLLFKDFLGRKMSDDSGY